MKKNKNLKSINLPRGFTLIEAIVSIVIVSILATIITISFSKVQSDARNSQRSSRVKLIAEALEKFYRNDGVYPSCNIMTGDSDVVINALKIANKDVLLTPAATDGINSIKTCSNLTEGSGDDIFAYVGVDCNEQACSAWTLQYREEGSGKIISLQSRNKTTLSFATPLVAIGAINGIAQNGQTLTAGVVSPSDASVTYQWQKSNTVDGRYTNISGAKSNTYTLTIADTGKYVRVVAIGFGKYSGSVNSLASSVIDTQWLTIGTQTWAKSNLNVGTMIKGVTEQTNNSVLEKYCYNDNEANCTTYGALYQWSEAMQYAKNELAQGICPVGSHIPADVEWKTLEMYLLMTQEQADIAYGWRGTDQGTQLKFGGSSGLDIPIAGYRLPNGSFTYLGSVNGLWASTKSDQNGWNAWDRCLDSSRATIYRDITNSIYGMSLRCLKN